MDKNETLTVTIEDISENGEGIGKQNGFAQGASPNLCPAGERTRFAQGASPNLCPAGERTRFAQEASPNLCPAGERTRFTQGASPNLCPAGERTRFAFFVKDTVIGDVAEIKAIKVKKSYGYGKLVRLVSPSPDRVAPRCPVASSCGGCQLQAMAYERQLVFKENKVRNHLDRIGGFENPPVLPVLGMEEPWHYRNKAQYSVARGRDGNIQIGFYAGRTHAVIETPHCYIGHPINDEILRLIREWMEKYGIQPYQEANGRGLARHILIRRASATGQLMVCLDINGKMLPQADALVTRLKGIEGMSSISVNISQKRTGGILGAETVHLYGDGYITEKIGELSFRISPQSFFQVNPAQTEILYKKVLEFADLKGQETVWDLYCGTGTIGLSLAGAAGQIYGIEIVPAAIADAKENAILNRIQNAEFFMGKAEEALPRLCREQGLSGDVVVVDPPRGGCARELLETVITMGPQRIVYVSCDSATLARDLKYLCQNGYVLEKVQPVDMFPMTVEIETAALLSQQNAKG